MSGFKEWWLNRKKQQMIDNGLLNDDGSPKCSWIESNTSEKLASHRGAKDAWEFQEGKIKQLEQQVLELTEILKEYRDAEWMTHLACTDDREDLLNKVDSILAHVKEKG